MSIVETALSTVQAPLSSVKEYMSILGAFLHTVKEP